MNNLFIWLLENIPLILFILAIVMTLLTHKTTLTSSYENCLRWMILLPVGVTNCYYFIMHVFFANTAASFLGWQNNPFQYEVGIANLSMGIIAIMAFKANFEFRKAAIIANSCWLLGACIGHVYEMFAKGSFVLGNSGPWFWIDVFVPIILILCLFKMSKTSS